MMWMGVAVSEVVCHGVGPREVEGDARTGGLVVGMCKSFLATRGFWRPPGGRVKGNVDHVACAIFVEVSDPVFSVGDPDVVVSACFSCDGGVVRVNPVGVAVTIDVIAVSITEVDVVVMVMGVPSTRMAWVAVV